MISNGEIVVRKKEEVIRLSDRNVKIDADMMQKRSLRRSGPNKFQQIFAQLQEFIRKNTEFSETRRLVKVRKRLNQ